MDFTLQDVLQGKLDAEIKLLNYFITLVKLHIWMNRKRGVTLNLSVLRTEKHSYEEQHRDRTYLSGSMAAVYKIHIRNLIYSIVLSLIISEFHSNIRSGHVKLLMLLMLGVVKNTYFFCF